MMFYTILAPPTSFFLNLQKLNLCTYRTVSTTGSFYISMRTSFWSDMSFHNLGPYTRRNLKYPFSFC